jgi:hypothetical protein
MSNATSPMPDPAAVAAAAAAQWKALEVGIHQIQVQNYFAVAATAAFAYDVSITFGREVRYIWGTKWSIPKFLFLFARYYGLFHLISVICIALSYRPPKPVCTFYWWNYAVGGALVFMAVINVVLVMRIHALYKRSTRILIVCIFLVIGEFAADLYATTKASLILVKATFSALPGIPIPGCLATTPSPQYTISAWSVNLFVATTFFALTLAQLTRHLRDDNGKLELSRMKKLSVLSPMLGAFFRDGILFFFLNFAVVFANALFTFLLPGALGGIGLPWITTICAVSTSRLILNLREAAVRDIPNSTWAETITFQRSFTTSSRPSHVTLPASTAGV